MFNIKTEDNLLLLNSKTNISYFDEKKTHFKFLQIFDIMNMSISLSYLSKQTMIVVKTYVFTHSLLGVNLWMLLYH